MFEKFSIRDIHRAISKLKHLRNAVPLFGDRRGRRGMEQSDKSLQSGESWMAGDGQDDWPNWERIRGIAGDAAAGKYALMVVQWQRSQEESEADQTDPPLRLRRLLRAVALQFREYSDGLSAWTQFQASLVLLAAVPSAGTAGVSNEGRLEYLLRETVFRTMLGKHGRGLPAGGGLFRCGCSLLELPERKTGDRNGPAGGAEEAKAEKALLTAWQRAWRRTLDESAILKGPKQSGHNLFSTNGIEIRYSPIISLLDGSLFGYEAVPYDKKTGRRWPAEVMFAEAEAAGTLYECDRLFREAAIRHMPIRQGEAKLFLPASASIIHDARLFPGTTLRRVEAAGIPPEQIVLMFRAEGDARGESSLISAVRHYRAQGFRIALSGVEVRREALLRLLSLHPDYARIDVSWVTKEDEGGAPAERMSAGPGTGALHPGRTIDEALLGALAGLTRREQIVLLAGGIERNSQIGPLIASGIAYGQGSWVGPEAASPSPVGPIVRDRIRMEVSRRYRKEAGSLSELTAPVEIFGRHTPVSEISRRFENRRDVHGFVIAEEGRPVGLMMKEKLHQMLSGQFGLPLYWNRPVEKIMDTQPLIVEESTPIDQVSQMAMAREPDKLYDAVVVTRDGLVRGIASIRSLLEWVTNARMADAQWANPLTGLPGNEPIRRELTRRIGEGRPFAVLYADVDYFKWFNDRFGFHRGDEVIRFVADLLVGSVHSTAHESAFVGHIGGDDFIAVTACEEASEVARQILERFGQGIGGYIDSDAGPVMDREGRPVQAKGLSMSLSLLLCEETGGWTPELLSERSALLKKRAKLQQGNSLVWETIGRAPHFANNLKHGVESP